MPGYKLLYVIQVKGSPDIKGFGHLYNYPYNAASDDLALLSQPGCFFRIHVMPYILIF